jgi:hypothetical protein
MKKFAWSWSRLKNYRSCPKKHWHVDLQKEYQEDSEALHWGDQVHKAMAERIAKGTPLPAIMEHYEDWPARIVAMKQAGMKVLVENKLAMSAKFRPTSFFDNETWFRGVLDVLAIEPVQQVALSFDWKTGAIKPDYEQLALSAQLIFAHYPEIRMVSATYVWLGNDDHTERKYEPSSLVPLWNDLWPEIRAMDESWRTTTYPPKPSGLCLKHCPVTSCPHYGKGSFR